MRLKGLRGGKCERMVAMLLRSQAHDCIVKALVDINPIQRSYYC